MGAGRAEARYGGSKSSLSPFLASLGPPSCPLLGPCLPPTCSINLTPAYMAFPSLRAPSSSASRSLILCFSWSSEALARRASSLCRAVNSPEQPSALALMDSVRLQKPGGSLPVFHRHSVSLPRLRIPQTLLLRGKNSLCVPAINVSFLYQPSRPTLSS